MDVSFLAGLEFRYGVSKKVTGFANLVVALSGTVAGPK